MNLKRLTALASGLALALPLTACGNDSTDSASGESFCDELESFVDEFQGMDDATVDEDPSLMADAVERIQRIAEAAPSDIQEDWNTMASAAEALSGLATATPDPEDAEALQEQMAAVGEMQAASENVNAHAEEECGVNLEQ